MKAFTVRTSDRTDFKEITAEGTSAAHVKASLVGPRQLFRFIGAGWPSPPGKVSIYASSTDPGPGSV